MKATRNTVLIAIALAVFLFLRYWGAQIPELPVLIEHCAPGLISEASWRRSIESDPTAHGYSAYGILARRRSNAAIAPALSHLDSPDPYLWLNAATYLGSRKRPEALPYLIKSLRHTAWRSVEERATMLQQLTGQDYGADFDSWLAWYRNQPGYKELDWESSLGSNPRLNNRANRPLEPTAGKE